MGPTTIKEPLKDFSAREGIIMVAFSMGIVWLGLYPQTVMNMVENIVQQLVAK
jgi:NADH:ubiquinone oxidoreductase subunit 4 (subunit M)